jgi:hypothetical protein
MCFPWPEFGRTSAILGVEGNLWKLKFQPPPTTFARVGGAFGSASKTDDYQFRARNLTRSIIFFMVLACLRSSIGA